MWPFSRRKTGTSAAPIFFANTLSGRKDLFVSRKPGIVSMYSCGPTVYGPQHIGNLRAALFSDVIARILMQAGYHVRRVTNITDVGHLVGDGDEGEDKMQVGAKRDKTTPKEIADRYTKEYLEDCASLNIDIHAILFPRATEYIEEQIALVRALEERGFTYTTKEGVYFDTGKYPSYGKLGGIMEVKLMGGARIKIEDGKRNLHDFVLWRLAKPGDLQQWRSPWGLGNPGWHIECSAMIRALLGDEIDIHTGGMDHIPVHHNNEIAQSECATGKPLAHYWLHEAFITIDGEKISKSLHNEVLLSDIVERGYDPLALRYFYLQANFRSPVSFSWDALTASDEALKRLRRLAREVQKDARGKTAESEVERRMLAILRDDMATPSALALLWETLKDEDLAAAKKLAVIESADSVLGLNLFKIEAELAPLPEEIQDLMRERDEARAGRDFGSSDRLREEIEKWGYRVDDGPEGTVVTPTRG